MERLAGLEPACIALEERCLNPLGHRRVVNSNVDTGVEDRTLLLLFVGEGLSTRKRPRHIGCGQDSNLRMNWLTASRLTTWLPHKTWSGTSDLNRDSLGPRPSGLIRFPSPRMSKIWSERLESNQRPRASETRALIQLSYAHKTLEQAAGIEPAFLR
jgi:hypothetical protein